MEPREHINKTAADTAIAIGKTRNAQVEQPSIAVSVSGSGVVATDANAAAAAVLASNRTKHEGNNTRRTTPLKASSSASTTAGGSDTVGQPQFQHQQLTAAVGGAYKGATTLATPSTPRIELSRASSSSHHEEDSRESSPENVFEQVMIMRENAFCKYVCMYSKCA